MSKKFFKTSWVFITIFLMISVVSISNPCKASTDKKNKDFLDIIQRTENETSDKNFEKILNIFEEKLGVIRNLSGTIGLWVGFFIGLIIAIVTFGAGIIMVPICAGIGWFIGDAIGFLIEDQLFPGF